ncbi:MAG TPA: transcriptional regulator [Acidobacteriaceae bacterium]
MSAVVAERIDPDLARELWTSFVSLLRGYTAAHGLNRVRQAVLEVSDNRLLVRAGERLLTIRFEGGSGAWQRESGAATEFMLDEHGRLIVNGTAEEMDIVAERLAREIMR